MKSLQTRFTHDGFDTRQLRRTGTVALFAKSKARHSSESFEVVIVQQHPAKTFFGKEFPARESMPPTESWGRLGWTFTDRSAAETRFNQLCDQRRECPFSPRPIPATGFSGAGSISTAVHIERTR